MARLAQVIRQFDPTLLPRAIAGKVINGKSWPFFVDDDPVWTKSKIVSLLGRHGINTWGWGATINCGWMFDVKIGQAEFAESLMLKNGVNVKGRLLTGGATRGGANTSKPKRGTKRASTTRGAHRGAHRR